MITQCLEAILKNATKCEIMQKELTNIMVNILKFGTLVCPPKRNRQTVQTKIRLLLKKQPEKGPPCLLFLQAFCEFQSLQPTFYFSKRKVLEILEHSALVNFSGLYIPF